MLSPSYIMTQIGPGSTKKNITPKLDSVSWFSSLLSLSSLKLKFYGYPLFFDKPTYRIDSVYVLYASCIPKTLIVG